MAKTLIEQRSEEYSMAQKRFFCGEITETEIASAARLLISAQKVYGKNLSEGDKMLIEGQLEYLDNR